MQHSWNMRVTWLTVLLEIAGTARAQPSHKPPATSTAPNDSEVALAVHAGTMGFECACEDSAGGAWGPFVEGAITKRYGATSIGAFASAAYFRYPHYKSIDLMLDHSNAGVVHAGARFAVGGASHGFDIGLGLDVVAVADDESRSNEAVLPSFELFANILVARFDHHAVAVFGAADLLPVGEGAVGSLALGLGFETN